jgi:hypothetical protein
VVVTTPSSDPEPPDPDPEEVEPSPEFEPLVVVVVSGWVTVATLSSEPLLPLEPDRLSAPERVRVRLSSEPEFVVPECSRRSLLDAWSSPEREPDRSSPEPECLEPEWFPEE